MTKDQVRSTEEALDLALEALELAQDNLREHGDNCFLHDEGEYNRCFCGKDSLSDHLQSVVEKLDEALAEQPAQQEPVANGLPLVIAGAIFDFAGYLTTRDIVIEVGSTANASPVADLVKDWAALRGLSLADAAVLSWQEWLTDAHANDISQERVDEMQKQRHDTSPPAQRTWAGLTDDAKLDMATDHFADDWAVRKALQLLDAHEAKLKAKNSP